MSQHQDLPVGQWTDITQGKVVSEGTYVDDEGYLRLRSNNSYAVWHYKQCSRGKVEKHEIVLAENGSPWCPECYVVRAQLIEVKNLEGLFKK